MSVYRPAKSKVWWFEFEIGGVRVRESSRMTSKARAREVELARRAELRDGMVGLRKRGTPKLFSVAAKDFIEAKRAKWSPGMATIATGAMKHLAPVFGRKLVIDIEASGIAKYQKARLAEGASPRLVNIEVGLLRAVLKRGGLWARIQPEVTMLPERKDTGHALTAEEEARLLDECGKSRSRALRPFIELALQTGARRGTLLRLKWQDLDFDGRAIRLGKDKTAAGSFRTIPMTDRAFAVLTIWAQSFPARRPEHFVFPAEKIGGAGAEQAFGFEGITVYEIDPTKPIGSIRSAWETARKRAGLEHVRIHDLRHSAVSRLIAARVPLPKVGKIVGWSPGTLALMAARYGHFSLDEMREDMSALDHGPKPDSDPGSYKKSPKSPTREPGLIQ